MKKVRIGQIYTTKNQVSLHMRGDTTDPRICFSTIEKVINIEKNRDIITTCLDCKSIFCYFQEESFYKSHKLVNKIIVI